MLIHRPLVKFFARAWVLAALLVVAVDATAKSREQCEQLFRPQSGQPGKDVMWVPTNDAMVVRMLQLAAVTPTDRVYDLGAGDGKIAIAAAKRFGATAVGVEYNDDLAKLAQCFAEADGVADRVRIVQGDIFATDFSSASVVTLYLLPELNLRLRPTLLQMKPGTRVVSHSFLMDDWEPDQRSMTEDGSAYLWIVPAGVAGTWVFQGRDVKDRFGVQLQQNFQKLSGTVGDNTPLATAELNGPSITLAFNQDDKLTQLNGRVEGNTIQATVTRDGAKANYLGTRR